MSYLVLARKYRPQAFEQVVEQGHITRTLINAISSGRVAHAILFAGPRGTGKTTVARILAKAMNCEAGPTPEPCNQCRSCREITAGGAVDVFEIDGASNNSVDQIRELRENIKYMPAHSSYKIYIIDEVHMLSMAAFNALLKTLEEPPAHVMFMFATTEPHKIPITILSRCQRHDFRRISVGAVSAHLSDICRREGFEISTESLGLIARAGGGSVRDALSLLDQIMTGAGGTIAHEQLLDLLGVLDRKAIFDLTASIIRADVPAVLDLLDDIYDRGFDMKKLYADLVEHFRDLLVAKMGKKIDKLVDLPSAEVEQLVKQGEQISAAALNRLLDVLFKEEASIRLSPQPKLALEMAIIRMLQVKPSLPIDLLIDKLDILRQEIYQGGRNDPSSGRGPTIPGKKRRTSQPAEPQPASGDLEGSEDQAGSAPAAVDATGETPEAGSASWARFSEIVSRQNPSLAANLAKCRLKELSDRLLVIEVVGNGFTLNMIRREKNIALLEKVCTEVFGSGRKVKLTAREDLDQGNLKKKNSDTEIKQKALSHPLIADAIEIFDGKLIDVKVL